MHSTRPLLAVAVGTVFTVALVLVPERLLAQNVLLNAESNWDYYDLPNMPPEIGGMQWYQTNYATDGSWQSGNAVFGFGEVDLATTLEAGPTTDRNITAYFRKRLTLSSSDIGTATFLRISAMRDDGIVVYLNGTEIRRDNMPTGAVNYDTLASGAVGGVDETRFFPSFHELGVEVNLNVGLNVIAVELHRRSKTDFDVRFDMMVEAISAEGLFGTISPPAVITFDPELIVGDGAQNYSPQAGGPDVGWSSRIQSGVFAGAVAFSFIGPGDDFVEGQAFEIWNSNAQLLTQNPDDAESPNYRIDLTNHTNVKFSFGLRTYSDQDGFETGDSVRVRTRTSTDGADFSNVTTVFTMQGGGSTHSGLETILADSAPKRALVPTSPTPDEDWRELGFDDSSWKSGTRSVGYERSSGYQQYIGIDVGEMYNRNQTVYVRIPFTVDDTSDIEGLSLFMRYDDGFVAFINGTQVASRNAPASLAWNSGATGGHADAESVQFIGFSGLDPNLLIEGDNLLAIHGVNRGTTSSDMLICAELKVSRGGVIVLPDPPVTLNDLNYGHDGPFYRYTFDIDDEAKSLILELEGNVGSDEAVYFDDIQVSGSAMSETDYESWVQLSTDLEAIEQDGFTQDPDGDGILNGLEYAFGGDPESATPYGEDTIMPTMEIVEDGGEFFLELTFRMLNVTIIGDIEEDGGYQARDILYIPQFSEDTVVWRDGVNGVAQATLVGTIEEDPDDDRVVVATVRFKEPIEASLGRLYARIKVDKPLDF